MEKETEREQEAAHALMMERLREALATLTPRQASCLHARFWEGKPFKEIAEAEGFTTSAAIVTVRNAIIKLQKYYIKRGWMEPPKEKAICTKTTPPKRNRKNDEREEVLKEIRQLENRQKILENKQRNEERKARTRRLIERGAILEGISRCPPTFRRRGQGVPDCPVPSSGGGGTGRKTAEIRGQAVSPLFTRAHLYTVAGVVRPAGGCCALRARWGATLPKPLVRSAQPNTRFAFVRLHRACHPSLKGGVPHRFLSYPRQYYQTQRGPFCRCRSCLPQRNQADK